MDAFQIVGGRRLRGRVRIHGSKNACLPLMAAALLTDEEVIIQDMPDLMDIRSLVELLETLGCKAIYEQVKTQHELDYSLPPLMRQLKLQVEDPTLSHAPYEIVRKMRAGICTLGPMLARRGKAKVSLPGGCAIGDRPVDLHLRGLEALGAQVHLEGGYIHAEVPGGRLIGNHIFLGGPNGSTVLGTANIMCAATLAEGRTIIESAACEPEVVDLARMLVKMGANIEGIGSPCVIIDGVESLSGVTHRVIPDRIEAGTYILASSITNGDITLDNCPSDMLGAPLHSLARVGVEIISHERPMTPGVNPKRKKAASSKSSKINKSKSQETRLIGALREANRDTVRIASARRLEPEQIVTQPFPGFPTDLQAQMMALLCFCDGNSIITEKIYPDRFMHVSELLRMGAKLYRQGPSVLVTGVRELTGAQVMASDLRASAGLVLAGLAARGTTTVNRVYHLDRGYERMELTLQELGADIERVDLPS